MRSYKLIKSCATTEKRIMEKLLLHESETCDIKTHSIILTTTTQRELKFELDELEIFKQKASELVMGHLTSAKTEIDWKFKDYTYNLNIFKNGVVVVAWYIDIELDYRCIEININDFISFIK